MAPDMGSCVQQHNTSAADQPSTLGQLPAHSTYALANDAAAPTCTDMQSLVTSGSGEVVPPNTAPEHHTTGAENPGICSF
jgi:hypothetical protein